MLCDAHDVGMSPEAATVALYLVGAVAVIALSLLARWMLRADRAQRQRLFDFAAGMFLVLLAPYLIVYLVHPAATWLAELIYR